MKVTERNQESRLPGLNLLLDDHWLALNAVFLVCEVGVPVSWGWECYVRVLQMLLCASYSVAWLLTVSPCVSCL